MAQRSTNPNVSERRTATALASRQPAAPSANGQPTQAPAAAGPSAPAHPAAALAADAQPDTLEDGAAQQARPMTHDGNVMGKAPANATSSADRGDGGLNSSEEAHGEPDAPNALGSVLVGTSKQTERTYYAWTV